MSNEGVISYLGVGEVSLSQLVPHVMLVVSLAMTELGLLLCK